jgi:signal transduction histidine kinase/DNA-binding response OmpR family regulator/HPt (histidine-containing phosphotransfer) domain-containing protein
MSPPTSPVRGRLHYLLAPALAVVNRLKYPQKFLLISLLFILPLALVMYLLISELNDRIAFTQKEVDGDQYLRPLRKLYQHTAQSRMLAHDYAAGGVALRPELIRKQAEIEEDFNDLQAVEQQLGHTLDTTSKYQTLRENWRFLQAKLLQLKPEDSEALHTQLLAEIHALAAHVGDTSNLILDPDLDSYYLMDAVLLKLPRDQELLAQARLFGQKCLAADGTITAEQRADFIRLVSLLRSNAAEIRHGMDVAFQNNPADNLKASLAAPLRDYLAEKEAFLRAIEKDVIGPGAVRASADDYDRLANSSLEANFDFWDRTVRELDGLLEARRDGYAGKKHVVELLAGLALLLVAYLWVAFYVGVMRTVRKLREASESMLGGSVDHLVTLETRDELGEVATSFNNIATRLRAEWTQAREESARARAAESALVEARDVAESANRAKSVFLATMSHEIRTPLNAVLGMASLLQDTELSAQQQEFARVIRTSGEALLGVINDILDFSKIEAGGLELEAEPLDVRACIEGAMDVIAVRGAEKGLELAYEMAPDVPPWIVGDVTRLRQILINLLSNAVKFTERGEVAVTVQSAPAADGQYELTFAVRDTGPGIPPDRLGRLFRSFSQVDASTTRKYGGTGLGLAISKRLAELMGGTMSVTSEPGEGSTFQFSIVAARATPPAVEQAVSPGDLPDPSTKRLLIVDDNETNRRIVTLLTQGWGFPTRDTGSPLEALRWLEAGEPFDLAILDIAMPEMDGLTLATAIRQRPSYQKMPLVAFTSLTRSEAFGDRREFDAFVTKPLKPALLLDVLVALLSGQQVQRGERLKKQEFDATLGQRLPLRLLVAEDVPVNQQMMRVMLSRMAYVADFADNGKEALIALERRSFDLVFMDMQMPEMDGLECASEINRRYPGKRPTIIALTANVTAEDERTCRAAGMDDFLTKPIKALDLRNCLERWGQKIADGQLPVVDSSTGANRSCEAPPAEVPLLDEDILADLEDLDAGEPGVLQSFLDGFRKASQEEVALIHQAVAAGDGEQLRKIAHRLKGTAANVGACGVADQCLALEKLGRSGTLAGAAPLVRELEQRCERTNALFLERGGS